MRGGVSKRRISNVNAATANNVPSMSFMEGLFGEEFPEAFRGGLAKSRKNLSDLPTELLAIVCEHISGLDIKQLRLASKDLASKVNLRIDRVYISPNRANLDYLQLILNHSRYRGRVYEIVWDDAQLVDYENLDNFRKAILHNERETTRAIENRLEQAIETYGSETPGYHSLEHHDLFQSDGRLTDVAKEIIVRYDDKFSRDTLTRNAMLMSIEDSYTLYQSLFQDEQKIMEQRLDVIALQQALAGFPKLKRVTITSEVWRPWHRVPCYNTPFYRSLPQGFRKPTVWPWHRSHPYPTTGLPADWRGYDIVVSAILAMSNPTIEEFILDSGNEQVGISYRIFCTDSECSNNTVQLLQRIPLKRLELTLDPWDADEQNYDVIPGLTYALAQMQHLEHFALNLHLGSGYGQLYGVFCLGSNFIPDNVKQRLKTLTLRNVLTEDEHLYHLLSTLPNVLRVTLDQVKLGSGPRWDNLFRKLALHFRQTSVSRPSFTLVDELPRQERKIGLYKQLVDTEVNAFLYGTGESPFTSEDGSAYLTRSVGWRVNVRDEGYREKMSEVWERAESPQWEDEM
jgi:hypothetical protein